MPISAQTPTARAREIAWRSRPLPQRLHEAQAGLAPAVTTEDSGATEVANRLTSWRRAVADGDVAAFNRRLAWDNLDGEVARRALVMGPAPEAWQPPLWAEILDRILTDDAATADSSTADSLPTPRTPPPAGLPAPIVRWVVPFLVAIDPEIEAFLDTRLDPGWITDAAWVDLASALWLDLAQRLAPFVATEGKRPLAELLGEFPGLARACCILTLSWLRRSRELVGRLEDDRAILAACLGCDTLPPLVGVEARLGDPHEGARRVMRLRFEGGVEVMYKPRAMHLEAALGSLVEALRAAGAELAPAPWAIARRAPGDGARYGWMERLRPAAIESSSAAAEAEALDRYHRRAGGLLCLATLLGAQDLHAENVVATADGPMLIDVETLLQPVEAHAPAPSSPLRATQLLTSPQVDARGRPFDLGGLRGRSPDPASPAQNRLHHHGEPVWPEDHSEAILAGAEATWNALASLGPGCLDRFRDAPVRVLLRPSDVYGRVLERSRQPRLSRSGLAASFLTEALNRIFLQHREDAPPILWPLARDEREALLAGDVPAFRLRADSTTLISSGGEEVAGWYRVSALDRARANLDRLTDAGRAAMADVLRRELARLRGERARRAAAIADADDGQSALLAAAVAVGEQMRRRAETGARWLAPDHRPDVSLSPHLYDGGAGIALFLIALARATGDRRWLGLAVAAAAPLAEEVDRQSKTDVGVGFCHGLGGWLYAAAALAATTGDPAWRGRVATISARLRDRLPGVENADLSMGVAGAMLAALAVGDLETARLASACLRERLEHRSATVLRPGAAHGLAGVARAARRFGEETDADDWIAIAARLEEREQRMYDPAAGGWPVDGDRRQGFVQSWCHGSAGILLMRLDAAARLDRERRITVDSALAGLLSSDEARRDHLCCGAAGRAEAMCEAGRALGRRSLERRGAELAGQLASRAARGEARLDDEVMAAGGTDLGLFRGLAGLGYVALRARDAALPSIVAVDPLPVQSANTARGLPSVDGDPDGEGSSIEGSDDSNDSTKTVELSLAEHRELLKEIRQLRKDR